MKVTIRIPDDLYRRVKSSAALRGLTVREVTANLYRAWLQEEPGGPAGTQDGADWLRDWLSSADEAIRRAAPRRSAREDLAESRGRLERR